MLFGIEFSEIEVSEFGDAGQGLYDQVMALYTLDPAEAQLLMMSCRTMDELADLEKSLADEYVMIEGSTGQQRVHPLFGEIRAHRALVATLLRQLRVVDESAGRARSEQARRAARARWGER